jgi:diaminohydroxyphosphoribosylaminopyrimidine deaminase/5-amino-6-(5-phosphoribosylamino)uracil reductase
LLKQHHRVFDFCVPISNLPLSKSPSSDPWEDFSNIFRREHQPLPRAWADVFGPLRKGTVDDCVIVGQIGQSLDGRVATESGHSKYINGPAGLVHLHRLRALVDAVVVGVGTAIADDPQLTVRRVSGRHPCLL